MQEGVPLVQEGTPPEEVTPEDPPEEVTPEDPPDEVTPEDPPEEVIPEEPPEEEKQVGVFVSVSEHETSPEQVASSPISQHSGGAEGKQRIHLPEGQNGN